MNNVAMPLPAAQKPFWTGTNFWFASLMLIGSFFSLSAGVGEAVVLSAGSVVATVGLVREWLKTSAKAKSPLAWLKEANTWNYLAGVVAGIAPLFVDLIEPLRGVVDAVIVKDWGALATRIFTLATMLYYILIRR